MLHTPTLGRRVRVPFFLVLGLAGLLFGCDLSDDDEGVSLVEGAWDVQQIEADEVNLQAQLEARYEALVFTFREDADGIERFNVTGQPQDNRELLDVSGEFDLDTDDRELTLRPSRGTQVQTAILLDFTRPDLDTLRLSADDGRDEDNFLDLIELGVEGEVDDLVVLLTEGRSRNTE